MSGRRDPGEPGRGFRGDASCPGTHAGRTAPESPGGDGRQSRGGTGRPRAHGTDAARRVLGPEGSSSHGSRLVTDPRAPEAAVRLLPVERTPVCAADSAADPVTHIPGGRALSGGGAAAVCGRRSGAHIRRRTERAGGARTHHAPDPLQPCSSARSQSVPLRAHGSTGLPERSLCHPPRQGASVALPRRGSAWRGSLSPTVSGCRCRLGSPTIRCRKFPA